jgi:hypothetical protein
MALRICAWCGGSLDPAHAVRPAGLRTHGLCKPCLERARVECGRSRSAKPVEPERPEPEPADPKP